MEKGSELFVLDYQLGNRLDTEGSQFFLAKKFRDLKDEFQFTTTWIKIVTDKSNNGKLDKFAREVRATSMWMKRIEDLRVLV